MHGESAGFTMLLHAVSLRLDRGAKRISLSLVPEGVTEEQLKAAVKAAGPVADDVRRQLKK